MELPKHIDDLIIKLNQKTIERKLGWSNSSRLSEYQCFFSKSSVTIDMWEAEGSFYADLAIFNEDGGQVERVAYEIGTKEYEKLRALYTNIIKSILKSDETFNSLSNDLDNL